MNGYKAFWKGKQIEVYAKTSFEAQRLAAAKFGTKKNYEVTVVLCEREDGSVVEHKPEEF